MKNRGVDKLGNKKAAIIGFGGMGQRHYAAYKKIGVDVVAICDWNKEVIQKVLPDFPIEHSYSDYEDLIENEKIDILSVVTNGPTHAETTIKASEAGIKNIFCEKPMTTNLLDAQKMIDICSMNETRLAINHIRRWSSDYEYLKSILKKGIIGDLRHIYFNSGSTGLGNFVGHFFDTMRYLTDSEPDWSIGFTDKTGTINPRGAQFKDPAGYGLIKFKNGVRCFIDSSEDTGVQYTFQLVGTYGRIIIDELNNSWQIRARNDDLKQSPLTRYGLPMEIVPFESHEFDIVDLTSKAILEQLSGKSISCSGTDGKKSLEMVISFHISEEMDNNKVYFPLEGKAMEKDVPIA